MFSISIIIPIFQVEKFIQKSIESICNQLDQDFEVILVNDGTADDSMKIAIEEFRIHNFKNYSVINQKNSGVSSARNKGLINSSAKYVCFLDPDDVIDKNYIMFLKETVIINNLDVCFCDFEICNERNRLGKSVSGYNYYEMAKEEIQRQFLIKKLKIHCSTILIKREVLNKNEIMFEESLKFAEDTELMWRLFSLNIKVGRIDAKLYKYLVRENSLMTSQKIENIERFVELFSKTISEIHTKGLLSDYIYKYLAPRVKFSLVHSYCRQSSYKDFLVMINTFDYKTMVKQLNGFPDYKVKTLTRLLVLSKKLFYTLVNNINIITTKGLLKYENYNNDSNPISGKN